MARTEITINALTAGGGGPSTNTLTNIDADNGMYLDTDRTDNLLLVVYNSSTTTAGDVKVLPGDNPPALRQALGTLTEEVAAAEFEGILIESARHAQNNGQIHIDFESGMAGKVAAYRWPVGVAG